MPEKECKGSHNVNFLILVTAIFLASSGILGHSAFAMGVPPGYCDNEYDGPITNATITVGTHTYYPIKNPVYVQLVNDQSYNLTYTIKTPSQNNQGNSLPGQIWIRSTVSGFILSGCYDTAYPSQNITISASYGHPISRAPQVNQTVEISTPVSGFAYTIDWVFPGIQSLVATPGQSAINLSWPAPTNDDSFPATNYKIYRSTNSGAETLLATLADTNAYTDNTVTSGQTYYYYVTYVTMFGESAASNEVSATPIPPPTPPQPPTGLAATAKMPPQAELSWTAPSDNGGSAVTGYKVERSTEGGTTWSILAQNTNGTKTSYTDSHLAPVKTYTYRVSAINSAGTSEPSNAATAKILPVHAAPRSK